MVCDHCLRRRLFATNSLHRVLIYLFKSGRRSIHQHKTPLLHSSIDEAREFNWNDMKEGEQGIKE